MKIDFKENSELINLLKRFTGNKNSSAPILGLGISQIQELVDKQNNKSKTIVYGVVKIYDIENFRQIFLKQFNKFIDVESLVSENSSYDALLPCVLYTDASTSFNFNNVVIDIYPTSLSLYGSEQKLILAGGLKISPCPELFWKDVPILRARESNRFRRNGDKEVILENDFLNYVIGIENSKLLKWSQFLDFSFSVLGSTKLISENFKTNQDVYISKLNDFNFNE